MEIHNENDSLSSFEKLIANAPEAPPQFRTGLIDRDESPTMSSLQIAEITGTEPRTHPRPVMSLRHYLQLARRLDTAVAAAETAWESCKGSRPCAEARALYVARLRRCERLQAVMRQRPVVFAGS